MDERNRLTSVFSRGINWDSREPFPPGDGERATGPRPRIARPRRPLDIATHAYGPANSAGSRHHSPPGHRVNALKSAGPGTGQDSPPDVARAPRLSPRPQPWSFQEPPDTASIYFPDNASQTGKNVVSEFGRGVLTPLSVDIAVFVVHNTAKMTVTHVFYNESPEPIDEAFYAFPVPIACTLTDFSYRVGNRKVVAVVEPAAQARGKFAKVVRDKRTAVLVEQDEHKSEMFMARLGNIPGEATIKTEFELVLLLERRIVVSDTAEASVATLTIPTTMASRYRGPVAEANEAPIGMPRGISINVEVAQSPELQDLALWSPSHNINPQSGTRNQKAQSILDLPSSTDEAENNAQPILKVTLVDKHRLLDKDFVLEIKTNPEAGGPKAQAWLGQHTDPDLPNQKALMIHIPPSALSSASCSKRGKMTGEIVFLLDQSNSMEDKIGSLTRATRFLLLNIPCGWTFNIWRFGSTYSSLWPSAKSTQKENINEALRWLREKCQGDMGGTEVMSALKAVLKDVSCPTQVLLLTDGQVWHLDKTLELVEKTRQESCHPIRFFCLGIGDMASRALVEGLADSGGGCSDVIYFRDPSWGEKLVVMLVSILAAHTKPIRVLLNGNLRPEPALQSPGIISRLNVLQEDRIFLLLDSNHGQDIKSVAVFFATEQGEEMEIEIPVHVLDRNDTTIHKLAARALLDDLELGRSSAHTEPKGPGQAQRIKERAEDIAYRWKLLSKWTSFLMSDQEKSDGLTMPPKPGSALMQTRLLARNPKLTDSSRLIKDRFGGEECTASSSEEFIRARNSRTPACSVPVSDITPRGPSAMLAPPPPRPRPVMHTPSPPARLGEAPSTSSYTDDVTVEPSPGLGHVKHKSKRHTGHRRPKHDSTDYEAPCSGTEEPREVVETTHHMRNQVQEGLDKREDEQITRTREEEQRGREYEWRAEVRREIAAGREAEEHARMAGGRPGREAEAAVESTEADRARWEAEERAAERVRLEVERRARDEQLHARREEETRRGFQKEFEGLAKMVAELAERVGRREVEDRESARKEAEERAGREDEGRRRADWEREKRMLEREMREAARADAERRLGQATVHWQVGRRPGHARAAEEDAGATPQTGQGAGVGVGAGVGRTQSAGEGRVWQGLNGPAAWIGRLRSGGESQRSSVLLSVAIAAVAGMAALAIAYVFFVSSFMFLSFWMIALRIFRM